MTFSNKNYFRLYNSYQQVGISGKCKAVSANDSHDQFLTP